ncbi:MAG: S-methyl-5'-thioinosine phosphorylase [Gammaproteobacteria bacterium]|nr:MAG: S-methyl-5'-thioinosine phosphorylase [Gammaproteobacteria bacterium]
MTDLAIIGGTGLTTLETLNIVRREVVHTPYGEVSAPIVHGELCGKKIAFLARHGVGHTIPPHMVNYRANIWALNNIGAKRILAIAAVGTMKPEYKPGMIAFPDQIIDYTHSRKQTFFESDLDHVTHIDFTYPYSSGLRKLLIKAAEGANIEYGGGGTYGATQGPRLETMAEIKRMQQDGCDIVGMTGMPEASLARELDMSYAACVVMANWAAGITQEEITMEEINRNLDEGMQNVKVLLEHVVEQI